MTDLRGNTVLVIESPYPFVCVCMCVIKVVIVDNGQSIRFFVFLHKVEWVCMVLRVSKSRRTSKLHDQFKSYKVTMFIVYLGLFWIWN